MKYACTYTLPAYPTENTFPGRRLFITAPTLTQLDDDYTNVFGGASFPYPPLDKVEFDDFDNYSTTLPTSGAGQYVLTYLTEVNGPTFPDQRRVLIESPSKEQLELDYEAYGGENNPSLEMGYFADFSYTEITETS
ncbi:hypothetical protein [Mycolicibacterium peregrinum]|uniref:hypothetical protein n=1 Tax=Mycolicibacterium peregrinum TaxID=43304 RepID=UPI003AABEAFD